MPVTLSVLLALGAAAMPFTECAQVPSSEGDLPAQWKVSIPQAWDNTIARSYTGAGLNISNTNNWALDQIMDGKGTINLCMRWGSNRTLTRINREHFEKKTVDSFQEWFRWLPGWDGFPFEKVEFNIVGWAASSKVLIEGPTDDFDVHSGFYDSQGQPTCDPACSREIHQVDGDYSQCPRGYDHRFHQFMHLDPSWGEYNMGAASSAGISISLWGWENVGSQNEKWPMMVHEIGHTISFPDYISDGTMVGNRSICSIFFIPNNAPQDFIMKPGNGAAPEMASELTDMEGWMMRHWWSRFSRIRGWQSDNKTWPVPPHCSKIEVREIGQSSTSTQTNNLCFLQAE